MVCLVCMQLYRILERLFDLVHSIIYVLLGPLRVITLSFGIYYYIPVVCLIFIFKLLFILSFCYYFKYLFFTVVMECLYYYSMIQCILIFIFFITIAAYFVHVLIQELRVHVCIVWHLFFDDVDFNSLTNSETGTPEGRRVFYWGLVEHAIAKLLFAIALLYLTAFVINLSAIAILLIF